MAIQFDFVYMVFPGGGRGIFGPTLDKEAAESYAEAWEGYLVGIPVNVKSYKNEVEDETKAA